MKVLTRQEAIKRLTARWNEQVDRFPAMRETIPLALYIRSNVAIVMRRNLLASYSAKGR